MIERGNQQKLEYIGGGYQRNPKRIHERRCDEIKLKNRKHIEETKHKLNNRVCAE